MGSVQSGVQGLCVGADPSAALVAQYDTIKSTVSVFVEKYLLSITAALTVLLIATNPMKFDWRQRIAGALALIFGSYFCAHTMEIRRETAKALETVAPAAPPAPVVRQTGPATTFGDRSPANTGDGNTFNDGAAAPPKKVEGDK